MNKRLAIKTGARSSPLSQAQLREVLNELRLFHPNVDFEPILVLTTGDKNLKISLRSLSKTNFFTKEIDELLLAGICRIGIHSAKDLPDPISANFKIVAVTKGVDSSDSLVLRPEDTLHSMPKGALIATSSERREDMVRALRSDLTFTDLRGTIDQRLIKLDSKEVDGVVIAEAALIRLGLTHLNRVRLPGPTTPFQGQLAVLARKEDQEMANLFSSIDARKKILYLGLEAPEEDCSKNFFHFPIIQVLARAPHLAEIRETFAQINEYTHFIFTSKNSVRFFLKTLFYFQLPIAFLVNKTVIAVGKKTAQLLADCKIALSQVAEEETAEGIINLLKKSNLCRAYICWPHSALSRSLLKEFFINNQVRFKECILYDTLPHLPEPLPALRHIVDQVEEIIFTSPSTVDAFLHFLGKFPQNKKLTSIGPITQQHIDLFK